MEPILARDIMTPVKGTLQRMHRPPEDPSVSEDTPLTHIEPAEITWVTTEAGLTIGYVTAVALVKGLQEQVKGGFWAQDTVGDLISSVFEDALDAMVVVDADGIILFLNRAYEVVLNIPRDQAIGRHVTEVLPNSRMHIVARSGIQEIGRPFQVGEQEFIVERHPV
ncbi:MAG TPA: PAS domain-containing protein, partial [Symbiobacteriaceae bacterium]|nr:PAS domain-containing protein [Symbiobacteriaceae bacterium]